MHKIASMIAVSALALALAACGGSDDKSFVGSSSSSSSSSGSSSSSSSSAASIASLAVTSDTSTIPNDGSTPANITALAKDANNNLVPGVTVKFAASSGGIAVSQPVTDATGAAKAVLSTAGDSSLRTITVSAFADGLSATVKVQVVTASSSTSSTEQMGNGSGTSFQPGVIAVGQASLSAGGSTGLQVSIVDQNGTLYTANSVTVTFNSPCVAQGLATITAANGGGTQTPGQVSTTTGIASATYSAKGCSGGDTITASAVVGTQNLSATSTVTVAQASIGSIQFVSATPVSIGLRGTGLNETSTVVFKVLDSTGGPRPGAQVSFTLNTSVGGLTLSPATATSAADGTVQTVVSSGTVHTTVRVTASIASPALSTQSSQLTVTTGLPTSKTFSIAVGSVNYNNGSTITAACPNVEAWSIDGVTVPFTVRLADRYNNPAPDGTAVAFTTNGGHIQGSCTTPAQTPGDGTCTVTWTSANPRPQGANNAPYPATMAAGRATVLATVIGEESFNDQFQSGYYQSGDAFDNLGEPYRDDNENGMFDTGEHDSSNGLNDISEYFLDFLGKGAYYPADGTFHGIVCTDNPAPAPGQPCNTLVTKTWAIGASHLLIMSTSAANITLLSYPGFAANTPGLQIAQASAGSLLINVQDLNGNAMAAGTTITITADSSIGSISSGSGSYVVPCDASYVGTSMNSENYAVYFDSVTSFSSGTSASGNITITVQSPSGLKTVLSIPVLVHS